VITKMTRRDDVDGAEEGTPDVPLGLGEPQKQDPVTKKPSVNIHDFYEYFHPELQEEPERSGDAVR